MPKQPVERKQRVIEMTAKCSDMFSALCYESGNKVGEYDGYVPDFFPGEHYGDYVILYIDADTGTIINWRKPTKAEWEKFCKGKQ
jgi:hypothetical protein